MNKRARNRLIGVTAIIIIAAVAIVASMGSSDGAFQRSVDQVVDNPDLVGERIQVSGEVVAGSWDRQSNPMRFDIQTEGEDDGAILSVVYHGGVPSTFGDGVVAVVTGDLQADNLIDSEDMMTKCPSRYEAATGALTVDQALAGKEGTTYRISGFVVADTISPITEETRFVIESENGSAEVGVVWVESLPAGMDTDSEVVIQGAIEDGLLVATSVALADTEK